MDLLETDAGAEKDMHLSQLQFARTVACCVLVLAGTVSAQDISRLPRLDQPADSSLKGRFHDTAMRFAADESTNGENEKEHSLDERLETLENELERLAELEEKWEEFEEATAKQKASASQKPTQRWTGRIHADFWGYPSHTAGIGFFEHPDPANPNFGSDVESRFAFRRLRLGLQGDILETMLYKLEVDYNNTGDPEYKDIYLGWKELPYNQQLWFGNQKRPIGLDHLNSSRYNVFLERPLVVEAFNEDARRIGLAMYGYSDDEKYNWRYGIFSLENTTLDGRFIGDSLQLSGNARVSSSPWFDESSEGRGYFHWAFAGMVAQPDGEASPFDTNANEGRFRTRGENRSDQRWLNTGRIANATWYEIAAVESILNIGPLQIVGEYQANWTQREDLRDLFFHGGYVYVSYFLTGEFQPYNRTNGILGRVKPYENCFWVRCCDGGRGWGLGAWQVAARYSYLDLTSNDIEGGVGENITLGVNWFWTPYSKVQFNYIWGTISEHEPVGGFTGGDYQVAGVRFMVDF